MNNNRKLTLSMNSKVIEAAKEFAAANDESLSSMVENFFIEKVKSIPSKPSNKKMQKIDFKGDFKKLRGIVKLPNDFDYEDFRRKRLEEKYLK